MKRISTEVLYINILILILMRSTYPSMLKSFKRSPLNKTNKTFAAISFTPLALATSFIPVIVSLCLPPICFNFRLEPQLIHVSIRQPLLMAQHHSPCTTTSYSYVVLYFCGQNLILSIAFIPPTTASTFITMSTLNSLAVYHRLSGTSLYSMGANDVGKLSPDIIPN